MHDGVVLQDSRVVIEIVVDLHFAACSAIVVIGFAVCLWSFRFTLASAYRVIKSLAELMFSGQEYEQTKLQRIVFSVDEYPGTLPNVADVRKAEAFRQKGDIAFGEGRYEEAVSAYSNTVLLNPSDHRPFSSRSACWIHMGQAVQALDDAELCVRLAPSFAQGYLRKGVAEQLLNRRVDAQASFKRGLSIDPDDAALQQSLHELRTDGRGSLQATLYHVLFASPHLHMDRLFQVLEDPDRLTTSFVIENKMELDTQFECLTQTLHVDQSLLTASPVLRDAYDRVTFACGQLLQWAPEAVTKHLTSAHRIVTGLGLALRCGWNIHHGVAKFSANALTILATSEGAADSFRREAVRLLLGGLLRWLSDPSPEPENPPEDREVCGCTFLSARLSAATWLERLFEHGAKAWVREECESFPDIQLLTVHLCLIVRDERAVPLGLPCLLRLPKVAKAIMEADLVVDLSTCNRDPQGRKDGRRLVSRQKGRGPAPMSPSAPPVAVADPPGPSTSGGELSVQSVARCDMRSRSIGGEADATDAEVQRDEELVDKTPDADDVARAMHTESDVDAHGGLQASRMVAPAHRLGEWMMTSLGYLLIFIDDDTLFAAHACGALYRLASSVPDGVARLTEGLWVGLPMLERISALACHHSVALELLEVLARHSPSARAAMCSLAGALAGVQEDTLRPSSKVLPVATHNDPMPPASSPEGETSTANLHSLSSSGQSAPAGFDVELEELETKVHERGERGETAELLEDGAEPSWVECFHELCDELWVERRIQSGHEALLDQELGEATRRAKRLNDCPEFVRQGLVSLGNFDSTAVQVPVTATATFSRIANGIQRCGASTLAAEFSLVAVPAVWNPRFADEVTGRLIFDNVDLGSPEWRIGKDGAVVALLRSSIQRSPLTPDWATAVWLCHEMGARAAIIINDLSDDGPSQPAFRMGLFGLPPPPIPAFMMSGVTAMPLLCRAAGGFEVTVRSVRWIAKPSDGEGSLDSVPPWPLVLRAPEDVAQAWSLLETVHRAAPSLALGGRLDALAERMCLAEKRVWLTRRLQRVHRGDIDSDELEEPPLAFVECDRHGDHLLQLRSHLIERTGICAPDITGEFEVRFKDESSIGSAVMREWMDILAQQAFLPAAKRLLVSQDHGKTFLPDSCAPFLNRCWAGDFELLGRLIGLALWQQVTLDLPLHPYVFKLLLHYDEEFEGRERDMAEDIATLSTIDTDLAKHKVQWLLSNDISALGYDMPFADVLCSREQGHAETDTDMELPKLPEDVLPSDALPGSDQAAEPLRLRAFDQSQVLLTTDGEPCIVTEANKMEFVRRFLQWRLRDSFYSSVSAMLRGIHAAVPPEVVAEARRMLTAEELCHLLAGSRDIHVDDWERNSRLVGGLASSHKEVKWFWQIVRRWGSQGRQDLLQKLLQFATGSRRVPVGGFARLVGFNGGKHLFTLAKGAHLSAASLPTSHACICTIDLPPWESFELASQKLMAAAEAGSARFDEGLGHEE